MKKVFFYGSLALMLGLTACKDSDTKNEYNFSVPTLNIITNLSDGTGVASNTLYDYELKDVSGTLTGSVSCSGIVLDGTSYTLKTNTASYQTNAYTVVFKNVTGVMTGNQNIPVSNGNFTFTTVFNTPQLLGLTTTLRLPDQVAVCQYNVGDEYTVKTFPQNPFYTGKTVTQYPSGDGMASNESKTIYYQLSLDLENNSADINIYNSKFSGSPMEPVHPLITVKGLDIDFSDGQVTVTGNDIIPEIVEGNVATPYPNYIFNTVEFKTTSVDLTECEFNYTVAGRFQGTFQGSYLYGNSYVTAD